MVDVGLLKACAPEAARALLGDGNFGGAWQKPDADMLALWKTGVEETREALEGPWPTRN
jgi:creatinine amidohydrolase